MIAQEAKQRLERIWKAYTSAYDTVSIEDLMAFDMATNALGAIEQIQWERDMAIKQLHDLGYGLGEKPREELNNSSQEVKKANVPDTNVGDMVSRRFVELLAEYHDPEICPYKEYKGKPYFSIKYIENGEGYIGYGTYNPKVLSQYLKKYFISSAQPERKTGEWIPCSERLPERYGNYLVSIEGKEPDIGSINPNNPRGWTLCDANGFYWANDKMLNVTAWMPLPEPYKGDSDEQQ